MSRTRLLLIVLLISLGLNIGLLVSFFWIKPAEARTDHHSLEPHCTWMHSPLRMSLDLSQSQCQLMETRLQELQGEIRPLQEALQKKRIELNRFLKSGEISENDLNEITTAISILQTQIEKKIIRHILQLKKGLRPGQAEKFDHFIERDLCHTPRTRSCCQPSQ